MGFEAIHQPKSRCSLLPWLTFCFCFLPCNSVLIRGKCFCLFLVLFPWLIFCFASAAFRGYASGSAALPPFAYTSRIKIL